MKIADERLFRKFDSFKEEVFRKKQPTKPYPPNPLASRFHMLIPISLIAGGLYLTYQQAPSLVDLLLKHHLLTHQQLIAYRTLLKTFTCRVHELKLNPRGYKDSSLPNQLYTTQLQSDQLYLREQRQEKVVDYELTRKGSWWMLGMGNLQKMVLINQNGDLVSRTLSSKLMIGSLRIWKRREDKVIKREKLFERYLQQRGNIGGQCKTVNIINSILLPSEEYQKLMQECTTTTAKIALRIEILLDKRLNQESKH